MIILFCIIIASIKWNTINIVKDDSINLVLFVGEKKQKKHEIEDKITVFKIKYFNWLEI